MRMGTIFLGALIWLLLAPAADACELPSPPSDRSPIETRRPIAGDDVRLTSGFGIKHHPLLQVPRLHPGIDWAAPLGTPVTAAGTGRVIFAAAKGEYGNAVVIDHGGGWQTLYGQLSRIEVREGDCVPFGSQIGLVGSTGLSSGPHLHFEVQQDGRPIDPMSVRVKNHSPEIEGKP